MAKLIYLHTKSNQKVIKMKLFGGKVSFQEGLKSLMSRVPFIIQWVKKNHRKMRGGGGKGVGREEG